MKIPRSLDIAAFIIIIAGVMYAQVIVTQLLLALFISIVCAQPILWLQKRKVSKGLSILIVFLGIVIVFGGLGDLVKSSLSSFSQNAPTYQENLGETISSTHHLLDKIGIDIPSEQLTKLIEPDKIMNLTTTVLSQLGSFMGNTLTIIFLVLFLLMELDSISLKTSAITKNTNITIDYINTIGHNIRHYLFIKTTTSFITGIVIWIGLAILGVDYAIIWGLLGFLLNYIPNIGSILAAVPAILFASIQLGFNGAIWTTIIFTAVNMIIGNMVEPRLMGRGMGLSTFIVFLALIFWGYVLGTVGMFLSVPLPMTIKIMLEQNPNTKWIAVVLGTDEDAKSI